MDISGDQVNTQNILKIICIVATSISLRVHTATTNVLKNQSNSQIEELHEFCESNKIIPVKAVRNIIFDYLKNNTYQLKKILLIGHNIDEMRQSLSSHDQSLVVSHETPNKASISEFSTCFEDNQQFIATRTWWDTRKLFNWITMNRISLWNLKNNTCETIGTTQGDATGLAFSSQGTHIAFGDGNSFVILNLKDKTRKPIPRRIGLFTHIQFSPDDLFFVINDRQGIFVWKPYLEDNLKAEFIGCHLLADRQIEIGIHPHNTMIAMLIKPGLFDGIDHELHIVLWQAPFKNYIGSIHAHNQTTNIIKFSSNGNLLFTGNNDGTIDTYEINEKHGAQYQGSETVFSNPPQRIHNIAVSGDLITVLASDNKVARLYRTATETSTSISRIIPIHRDKQLPMIAGDNIVAISHHSPHQLHVLQHRIYDIEPSPTTTQPLPPAQAQAPAALNQAPAQQPLPIKAWWQRIFSKKNMIYGLRACSAFLGLGSLYMAHKNPERAQTYKKLAALGLTSAIIPSLYRKHQAS